MFTKRVHVKVLALLAAEIQFMDKGKCAQWLVYLHQRRVVYLAMTTSVLTKEGPRSEHF